MDLLLAYLPQDRRRALATGVPLPDRCTGTVLFADIASFTALGEALSQTLGSRQGAEVLIDQINAVYTALIATVDQYGGSVIGFAGDSITCWFDDHAHPGAAAPGAVACALAQQVAMRAFADLPHPAGGGPLTLGLKTAVASGPARRFLVGDPAIQVIDVLAGTTLLRLAQGAHLARQGEIVLDTATLDALGQEGSMVAEWRADPRTGEHFAVCHPTLPLPAATEPGVHPPSPSPPAVLAMDQLRPWLPRVVFDRLASGQGEFLTELRPAVALFLRFASLDYDDDPQAHTKLAAYIRWVQQTVVHSDGALLDVTVGDKGSYLYAAWGAPTMHEDDTRRAVAVDHALRTPPPEFASVGPVQIGLSRGVMRTGPCGSPTRRNYGVMGDAVNLTARLMEAASPGQVLASEPIATATITEFVWTPLPAIQVKGKREPVAVYDLGVGRARETIRLHEPRYPGPLLGRSAEQAQIAERLLRAAQGHGQIIGISGEAGLGKSRLVTEVVQQCQEQGWRVYGGAAEAYRRHTPYLAWTPIWRGLFGLPTSLAGNATAQASRIVTLVAEQRLLFRSGCRCWGPCWTWRSRRRP